MLGHFFPAKLVLVDFRLVDTEVKLLVNANKNILDGDLVWKFLHLSLTERTEMARRIGTTNDQVRKMFIIHKYADMRVPPF